MSFPRVAVFFEADFPIYGVSAQLTPRNIVHDLKAAGFEAELLDSAALADAGRFTAQRFAALILPQGNTFPKVAFANLKKFHQERGSLITSGIPFTHPVIRKDGAFVDTGHEDAPARFGENGIGVGGFAGPGKTTAPATIAPGDPLRLKGIVTETPLPRPAPQWLDPRSLPKGVRCIPALGDAARPLVALVVHESGPFSGAVDAWTYRLGQRDREGYESQQLIVRATVAALAQAGKLSASETTSAFRRLDALPRPAVYTDIVLPSVPRRYSTFQPKMPPPARQLHVADIRACTPEEKVLLFSLQGLVNRTQPRIYFLTDNDDMLWLDELQRQGATDKPLMVSDPFSLLETFKKEYRGAVLCDPKVYASPCVAVTLAGQESLLVCKTPELAKKRKLTIKADLRGKFADNAAALRYIRTKLISKQDPYLTCSLDPTRFDQGGLDHLIASRASVFWITGPKAAHLPGADMAAELEELRAYLAKLPLGAVVRGFWWHEDGMGLQEDDGVALGSRFGKITLVSDLITNLSVHSGVPATTLKQKPRPAPPKFDPTKVYVCFTMSDGDNLCTWRGYFRRYFEDPVRGQIPVGWGMGPTLIDLAPTWARWYYEHATPNDEFICDVSGVGYIYPPSWGTALKESDEAFRYFYGRTQDYMKKMDMATVRLMDVDAADIAKVGALFPQSMYLMPDYGHAGVTNYHELTYTLPTGQSVFRAATSGSGPEHFAQQIRERVGQNRPAFINAFIWNWGSKLGDLKKTMEILGDDFVAVTPSQLESLYRRWDLL
ncbi:GxGYxYP domain-containing protein [Armatimonas sp.]|uniref:GxGYxYP domain-containing protein n=1 Tax=Armatimonas sp. TaxID=1872638 RepID=UPI00286C7F0D|nr:GxGYxYP domain-containing protein [Armatimonas sp.]